MMEINEYRPKFSSEVYLKFLCTIPSAYSNVKSKEDNSILLHLVGENFWYRGNCLMKCLDQAIIETGFNWSQKMEDKYTPLFTPQFYLKFLNSDSFKYLWDKYRSFEECLDEAILKSGFDKTLESK